MLNRVFTVGTMLALCVMVVGQRASAQEADRQGVTVQAAFTPAVPREAPPVPHTLAFSGGFRVVNWSGLAEAPASLDLSAATRAIILADELTLPSRRYDLRGVEHLILVADTLRVAGDTTLALSATAPGQAGGSLTVLARRIICEPGGALDVRAAGRDSDSAQAARVGGGAGGSLVLAIDEWAIGEVRVTFQATAAPRAAVMAPVTAEAAVEAPPPPSEFRHECLHLAAPGGRGPSVAVRDHRSADTTRVTTRRIAPAGELRVMDGRAGAMSEDDGARHAFGLWAVDFLERLRFEIYEASRVRDERSLLELFQQYERFDIPGNLLHPELRQPYNQLVADLNAYRDTVLAPLYVEVLALQRGNVPRNVSVFTEGATLRQALAPTEALALQARVGQRDVLGLLEFRPERPDELAVEFELQLTVDPWLASLAAQALAERPGDAADMTFTKWSLTPHALGAMGVQRSVVTLVGSGDRMRVRLELDGRQAGLVFWRLFSTGGLPLSFDWEYRERDRVVNGTWAAPALTLARRALHDVAVEEDALINRGTAAVTIEYLQTGPDAFEALVPALVLQPGEGASIGALVAAEPHAVSVPAEAVVTAMDPMNFERDFFVINGEEFVDEVTVTNLLPPYAEQWGGALEHVEIFLTAQIGDDPADEVAAGPFRLSATGPGAEITVPFLRLGQGRRIVTVTGTARWEGGSFQTLSPETFDTHAILITEAMLPEP